MGFEKDQTVLSWIPGISMPLHMHVCIGTCSNFVLSCTCAPSFVFKKPAIRYKTYRPLLKSVSDTVHATIAGMHVNSEGCSAHPESAFLAVMLTSSCIIIEFVGIHSQDLDRTMRTFRSAMQVHIDRPSSLAHCT